MAIKCLLSCKSMNQQLELVLSESFKDMSSVDFSKCSAVFEDGSYSIQFLSDQHLRNDIMSIEVCVNGETVGNIILNDLISTIDGRVQYKGGDSIKQLFLLHYDLIILSFILVFNDGSSKELYSDYLLCMSKNKEDVNNIQRMLQALIEFDDSQVGEWIFSNSERNVGNSLYLGKWNKYAYKSLSSYIQLLEQIIFCYKNNYTYFKMQGKHTIKKSSRLVPYNNVKTISRDSFNWIMQNTDQLSNIPVIKGVQFQGKNYLPYHIRTDASQKSWDVYENKVVISFLYTTILKSKQIYDEFDKDILNEERVIAKIHGIYPKEYCAPIITVKTLQISFCRLLVDKLNKAIETLQAIYKQYLELFDVSISKISTLPRKTSTFREIKPYIQIFEIIVRWFKYGEYSLEKEKLILQVKTLDKLFEYYCLLRLLKLLANNGFQKANMEKPVYKFNYKLADDYYDNEKDVANTYILSNNNGLMVTLYYQPVISSIGFENNLTLFRTTKPYHLRPNYYTPDFVLKFSSSDHNEEYIIFDAKFSSRTTIRDYSLQDVIRKYSCEFSTTSNSRAVKMVWILQGRVKNNENSIWYYHNSSLASLYHPFTTYGIVPINTTLDIEQQLWNEIKKSISLL